MSLPNVFTVLSRLDTDDVSMQKALDEFRSYYDNTLQLYTAHTASVASIVKQLDASHDARRPNSTARSNLVAECVNEWRRLSVNIAWISNCLRLVFAPKLPRSAQTTLAPNTISNIADQLDVVRSAIDSGHSSVLMGLLVSRTISATSDNPEVVGDKSTIIYVIDIIDRIEVILYLLSKHFDPHM